MRRAALVATALCAVLLAGCEPPGKPKPGSAWKAPQSIIDFHELFTENCLGCHGDGQVAGPAIRLNDPLYLAIIPRETMRNIVANGLPGTAMPPFVQEKGGMLTDRQIDIIVDGIFQNWAGIPPAGPLPPYAAAPGDAAAGAGVYHAYRDALAKNLPREAMQDGFMANASFLALVSDQYLRTLLIAGRPDLGIPDFRSAIPGRPLTDQEIADITAYLISQRKNEFGQPLSPATTQP